MHWSTPIVPTQYDVLIAKPRDTRRQMKLKGEQRSIVQPQPKQVGDGKWRDQGYVVADAVIFNAVECLIEQGLSRKAATAALDNIQIACAGKMSALDEGLNASLVLAHNGRDYFVATGHTTAEAMNGALNYFSKRGSADPTKLAFHAVSLRAAYDLVRDRARAAGIALPDRFWPTLSELDLGASAIAEAIAPRRSPVIEAWLTMRAEEHRDALS